MSQTYTPPAPATSAPGATFRRLRWMPLAVWAVLSLAALGFVGFFGTNAPYADEWEFVPVLVGHEPRLPWLWAQHNEHRLPLPRAVYLALLLLTHDFRSGMVLQVAMLSALALLLMRLAENLRGGPHWADAFFPISMLHLGHWENFVMGYQICFVLFAVLASGLAVLALRITRENAFRSGVCAGVLLALLALTGGSGLAAVPPVAVWLAFVGVKVWRSGSHNPSPTPPLPGEGLQSPGFEAPLPAGEGLGRSVKGALLLLLAALPLAYLAAYFVGYQRPSHHPVPSSDPLAVGRVAGEVLAMSLGVGLSGVWWAVYAGMIVLGVATVTRLVRRWKEPGERLSVVGLIAIAAGVTGVAVAIGVGRGAWGGGMGLWSRYSLLVWPLLALAYLAWVKVGGKWVPMALCLAAALAFPGNMLTGLGHGIAVKLDYSAIEAEARQGRSAEEIVKGQFAKSHHAAQAERAVHAIPLLREARIGIFAEN